MPDSGINGASWVAIVSSVVNVGFSVVVGIYLLTRAIPKMQEEHSKMLDTQRADYVTELRQKRADYLAEMKGLVEVFRNDEKERRNEYRELLQIVVIHCREENATRDQMLKAELSSLNHSFEEQARIFEDVRDAIKELRWVIAGGKDGKPPTAH